MSVRTVLVGNAPLTRCMRDVVDSADRVVRFNKAAGYRGLAGFRTDQLWLVNHGGQMAEWLESGALHANLVMPDAGEVVLPVPMLPGHLSTADAHRQRARSAPDGHPPVHADRINHLEAARAALERAGHRVSTLDAQAYRAAQQALQRPGDDDREAYPSTGFLAIHHTLTGSSDPDTVELVGFTFEGWRGHSWQAERRWVEAMVAAGRLTLHPMSHEAGAAA